VGDAGRSTARTCSPDCWTNSSSTSFRYCWVPSVTGGQPDHPIVEPLAALTERVLLALVRAGDETVQ
jgi:hypothetical protein